MYGIFVKIFYLLFKTQCSHVEPWGRQCDLRIVNLPLAGSSVENSYGRQSQSVIHKVYLRPKCHPPSNLPNHERYTGWASSFPTLSDMIPGWTVICTMFLTHRTHISIELVNVLGANSPITVPWFPQWILLSTGEVGRVDALTLETGYRWL